MVQELDRALIAAIGDLGDGVGCLTTHRDFEASIDTPWADSAPRLVALAQGAGFDAEAVVGAGQVHGAEVAVVADAPAGGAMRIAGVDGIVTNRRGVVAAVRTADCVPVVVADAAAGLVGVFHAGWRGTRAGIAGRGVATMVGLGARVERMRAWIGPAICGMVYEVSDELAAQFAAEFPLAAVRVVRGRYLDLPALNMIQLTSVGIRQDAIVDCGRCTFSEEKVFHSHRRQGTQRGHLYTLVGFTA